MILKRLNILNWKNIREANLDFSDNLNLFVGLNGQGKTNVLDAIYMLSFTKSAFTQQDSSCISHGEQLGMVQGDYQTSPENPDSPEYPENPAPPDNPIVSITCGLKTGVKKQFRWDKKDYKRLIDHIGRIPLVMVCPQDQELLTEGSDERRRFMDSVISQQNRLYLEKLTQYNALLKQRNVLLKQLAEREENGGADMSVLEVYEMQMAPLAEYIYGERKAFIEHFGPIFRQIYGTISGGQEIVSLEYISQLSDRDLSEAYIRTRQRDLILGWTSQGIHKDELSMLIRRPDEDTAYAIRQVGSQGQQKTYVLAMKLAQAMYLGSPNQTTSVSEQPILLLDDIFDKLDSERVARIVELVKSEQFGQIFITDTDRQHLVDLVRPDETSRIFNVENGCIH